MEEKKLGLFSVVSTGVGLIVATTCLMSLCQGSAALGGMFIVSIVLACALNMITAASLAELNALMPNLTSIHSRDSDRLSRWYPWSAVMSSATR